MGLIYKQMKLQGNQGEKEIRILFDTDASQCFVRKDIAEEVTVLGKAPRKMKFETATGVVETEEAIFADVWLNGTPLFWTFIVVPDLTEELILGADFFQRWKISLDPEREDVTFDHSALKMKLV